MKPTEQRDPWTRHRGSGAAAALTLALIDTADTGAIEVKLMPGPIAELMMDHLAELGYRIYFSGP